MEDSPIAHYPSSQYVGSLLRGANGVDYSGPALLMSSARHTHRYCKHRRHAAILRHTSSSIIRGELSRFIEPFLHRFDCRLLTSKSTMVHYGWHKHKSDFNPGLLSPWLRTTTTLHGDPAAVPYLTCPLGSSSTFRLVATRLSFGRCAVT